MKNIYNRLSNITINFIANHILIIMLLSITILSIAILISKHDLKFLLAPTIAFFVPFLIMKFNKHKEEKQNEDFKKIIDESIFNAVREFTTILNKFGFEDFYPDEIEKVASYNHIADQDHYEVLEYNFSSFKNYYDNLVIEMNHIKESKLQFYNIETFNKYKAYVKAIQQYKKHDTTIDNYALEKELYLRNDLYNLLNNNYKRLIDL